MASEHKADFSASFISDTSSSHGRSHDPWLCIGGAGMEEALSLSNLGLMWLIPSQGGGWAGLVVSISICYVGVGACRC